jgi:uncharacterized membrane protein
VSSFSQSDAAKVAAEVARVEQFTSAQIKVVVLRHSWIDIRDRASQVFRKHGLDKTEFAVFGDRGIHRHVGQAFWDDVRNAIAGHLAEGRLGEGITAGVRLIGAQLCHFFPKNSNTCNEISDDVIFQK